jgi:hypothetical protein
MPNTVEYGAAITHNRNALSRTGCRFDNNTHEGILADVHTDTAAI